MLSKDTRSAKCSVFYANEKKGIKEKQEQNCWVKLLRDIRTGVTEGIDDCIIIIIIIIIYFCCYPIQLFVYLFTCLLNSPKANYKGSMSKEANKTRHTSLRQEPFSWSNNDTV
jgi:hypothetical protein